MTSIVGQAILPAAAFQAALAGSELHFAADERRLKSRRRAESPAPHPVSESRRILIIS